MLDWLVDKNEIFRVSLHVQYMDDYKPNVWTIVAFKPAKERHQRRLCKACWRTLSWILHMLSSATIKHPDFWLDFTYHTLHTSIVLLFYSIRTLVAAILQFPASFFGDCIIPKRLHINPLRGIHRICKYFDAMIMGQRYNIEAQSWTHPISLCDWPALFNTPPSLCSAAPPPFPLSKR